MTPRILALYNPVCGPAAAKALFDTRVLPLLSEHGRHPAAVVATTHEGHAGEVVRAFLDEQPGDVTVILGSGDGTLHEIVCALHAAPTAHQRAIAIVLVPCGTANALYASLFPPTAPETDDAWKLQSLHAFLCEGAGTSPRPLTFAVTTIGGASSVSAVVASTALHASILHDSEALRAQYPGIERFKLAAQQNLARWYAARVTLLATPDVPVQVYDPSVKQFVPYDAKELEGPFVYFVSTVNVDRLETAFRIAPLHSTIPPGDAPSVDIVVMRPQRGQPAGFDQGKIKEQQPARSMTVLGGAYRNGVHVDMRFNKEGEVVEDATEGETVVEYFRCAGWEWVPVSRFLKVCKNVSDPCVSGRHRRSSTLCMCRR